MNGRGPDPETVFTVSDLTNEIRALLGGSFAEVLVEGEISRPSRPASGHIYLTLKDEDAVLPCVIWRSAVSRLQFEPEAGQAVLARGYIDVYPPHGKYQLIIRQLEPVGTGALQLAFEQMRKRLEAEGLFAPERKRDLPPLARRVALVTSKTGAAVRDMVTVIRRRSPNATVLLVSVRVQGEGSAEEIAAGLRFADAHANADVILVGRGGGSLEDLWAFNEEVVARAIFACETPVVSAVGHETDVTIADLVADVRAATPSQAGELAVPDVAALSARLDHETARLANRLRVRLERAWQRVEALAERPALRDPGSLVSARRTHLRHLAARLTASSPIGALRRRAERVATLGARLGPPVRRRLRAGRDSLRQAEAALSSGVASRMERRRRTVEAFDDRLRALSPLAVLRRGYSLTTSTKADGTVVVVRDATDVAAGDTVRTRLASGAHLESTVERVELAEDSS